MTRKFWIAAVMLLATAGLGWGANAARAQDASAPASGDKGAMKMNAPRPVPPYHKSAPKEALPETLNPDQFPSVEAQNIYALAAKIKKVLYQEPCYCGCDKEVGHKSLLDCYVDNHGSFCNVCKREAVFTYQQTELGKTPAEIRKAIIAGDWKNVDLSPYDVPAAGAAANPGAQ
jgi:hypothetical protein